MAPVLARGRPLSMVAPPPPVGLPVGLPVAPVGEPVVPVVPPGPIAVVVVVVVVVPLVRAFGRVVAEPGVGAGLVVATGMVELPPGTVVVPPGRVVATGVEVVVVGGGELLQVEAVMIFDCSVTAAVRAKSRPWITAPVFALTAVRARMVPTNTEFVPRVAELPIFQ